jgi:ribonuclease D
VTDFVLVETGEALASVIASARNAARLAVDAEANGLHAFRTSLCVLQLAWPEAGGVAVAVIDALAVPIAPLAPLLGPEGPLKILHDLTFDARLLAEAEAPLGRVRDTSVAARFLGFTATGLAGLLGSELGVAHAKDLQQHDWSRRPLTPAQIDYLAGDVRHLLALDDRLVQRAEALDITPEIADECAYKLATAAAPPRDGRPAYVRVKGAAALDPPGRAILRRLCQARDEAAAAADVPAFKVIGNEVLLDLARLRPRDRAALAAVRGAAAGAAGRWVEKWLAAIAAGIADGDVPPEDRPLFTPTPPDRASFARRRACEGRITAWRKAEAARRGVDAQVVLPGHCASDLADILVEQEGGDAAAIEAAIARIPGLGARRRERYLAALAALASPSPRA